MNKVVDDRSVEIIDAWVQAWVGWWRFSSSAKKLERCLAVRGIVPDEKLFYEYKLPGALDLNKSVEEVSRISLFAHFYKGNLENDIQREYFRVSVTADEIEAVNQYVLVRQQEYVKRFQCWVVECVCLNPELRGVRVDRENVVDLMRFADGVLSGYAPREIDYYLHRDEAQCARDDVEMDVFEKEYGFNVGYILAPETRKKVVDALKARQNKGIV